MNNLRLTPFHKRMNDAGVEGLLRQAEKLLMESHEGEGGEINTDVYKHIVYAREHIQHYQEVHNGN